MPEKIVRFDSWCDKCKYSESDPGKDDNPCNNCLNIPANMDSNRPMFFVAKEKK